MKIFLLGLAIIATTCAQSVSNDYLPPVEDYSGAGTNAYETNVLENEPAHSLSDDGYRYKTIKRYRLRHRRDVNELTSYLPPHAASTQEVSYAAPSQEVSYAAPSQEVSYAAPAQEVSYQVESAPQVSYSAPQSFESSYESAASEPAHTLSNDGYRYKTVKRYRLRHRRDVNELTSYLPPHAASTQEVSYAAPSQEVSYAAPSQEVSNAAPAQEVSYQVESAPQVSYSAPQSFESSYESAASEPAHTLSNDGYRYKTVKRYRLRHRRDVNELTSYLPPHAASTQEVSYAAPSQEVSYAAPSQEVSYSAPAQEVSYQVESAPQVSYSAPQSFESSYESAASEPAHTLSNDGYRYKTVKRYRLRHRRDVNELTSYLPPHAASTQEVSYAAPSQEVSYAAPSQEVSYAAPSQEVSYQVESAPQVAYSAPQSFETSYESAASEPAHTLSNDGYRYKTVKRYRLRHRRDVNELTSYLPPHAASTQEVSYAAPSQEVSYAAPSQEVSYQVESAPQVAYSAPQSFETSYESAASEPAHTLSDDGYRYKTVRRYRLRHRH